MEACHTLYHIVIIICLVMTMIIIVVIICMTMIIDRAVNDGYAFNDGHIVVSGILLAV